MDFKPFTIERPWGAFRQLNLNSNVTVKVHRIKPEGTSSWQSHKNRSEFWHIVSGTGKIIVGDDHHDVKEGDEVTAEVGVKHRWIGGENGMIVIEVATGFFDEEDITRFEDKYGRAQK